MKDERELPYGTAAETPLEMGNIGTGSNMASLSHIIGEKGVLCASGHEEGRL